MFQFEHVQYCRSFWLGMSTEALHDTINMADCRSFRLGCSTEVLHDTINMADCSNSFNRNMIITLPLHITLPLFCLSHNKIIVRKQVNKTFYWMDYAAPWILVQILCWIPVKIIQRGLYAMKYKCHKEWTKMTYPFCLNSAM